MKPVMNSKGTHHALYRYYLYSVVLIGLSAIALSAYRILHQNLGSGWIAMASLTIMTGFFTIKIPGTNSRISVAETFIITNLLLFGPAVGCITAGFDGLFGSIRGKRGTRSLQRMLFNTSVMALSALAAGEVFRDLSGIAFLSRAGDMTLEQILMPLAVLVIVYYLVNTLMVAAVIGLDRRQRILTLWHRNFLWSATNYVTAAMTAGLIALETNVITPAFFVLTLFALASSYSGYRNYLARVAESHSAR